MKKQKNNRQNIWIIAAGIILLAAICIVVAIFVSQSKKLCVVGIEVENIEHIDKDASVELNYSLVFEKNGDIPKWVEKKVVSRITKKLELDAETFSPSLLKVELAEKQKDGTGKIKLTAKGDGAASFYVRCADVSKTVEVIVGVLEPEYIVSDENVFVAKGTTVNVNAKVGPLYCDDKVVYGSEDSFVARVDDEGNVTFVSTGETYIYCTTSNGLSSRTKVTSAIVAEKFEFDTEEVKCSVNSQFVFGYSLYPEYVTYGSDVLIYSEDESVIKYDSSKGAFVAVGAGETNIVGKFMSAELLTDVIHVTVSGTRKDGTQIKPSADSDKELKAVINENIECRRDSKTKLSVKNIRQKPQLPNGCEITSATIVLNYLGYNVDKVTMADNYLKCGKPYNKTDPNEAYMGDPHGTGWYCFAPVIEDAVNKYFVANGYDTYRAYDITGTDVEKLKKLIDEGTPVVFWGTLYFNKPYYSNKFTLPDGSKPYSNLHCLVLTGYEDSYFYISDPLELSNKVAIEKFTEVYELMGKRAVKIVEK